MISALLECLLFLALKPLALQCQPLQHRGPDCLCLTQLGEAFRCLVAHARHLGHRTGLLTQYLGELAERAILGLDSGAGILPRKVKTGCFQPANLC